MGMHVNGREVRELLRKDLIVRWRQKVLSLILLAWPVLIFMLLYLIRLKYGSEQVQACQYPTRLLPTKNQVVPAAFSYICSIENRCQRAQPYEEYSRWKEAPLHSVIDVVNAFVTDEQLRKAVVELADKANFVSAITTLITSDRLDIIRSNISEIISLVPEIERRMNYSFDIKHLFSNRDTFVKLGILLCGHPFPSTDTIPLINEILESEDFSEADKDVELEAMPSRHRSRRHLTDTLPIDWRPTKYCKQLYRDVTSTNQGKLTWNTIKPIIQGKILYYPDNEITKNVVKFSNASFEELDNMKQLSRAAATILTKLHTNTTFQEAFDSLLKLARSPLVKSLVGEDFDIGEIERVFQYIRTNQLIHDILNTVADLMDCVSADRFEAVDSLEGLQRRAYELNQNKLFLAALNLEDVGLKQSSYRLHMDTDNTQPTFENRNRFWFPGPADSMVIDLKYHRGFVQLKQMVDLGIIKAKRDEAGILPEEEESDAKTSTPSFTIKAINSDDDDDFDDEEDFDSSESNTKKALTDTKDETTLSPISEGDDEEEVGLTTEQVITTDQPSLNGQPDLMLLKDQDVLKRTKRQGFLDFLGGLGGSKDKKAKFQVDDMQFYTKQFPYPAFLNDVFKRGLYLAQGVQVAYLLGLVVAVALCVRERIWMRESRNSMLMRSMGLKAHSELVAWSLMSLMELCVIFMLISAVLYSGGILAYTNWFFVMFYCLCFGICLISFCYMCSNFFNSANIGAVATALLFFITLCPFIIVLMFDAKLSVFESFLIDLSFTTAFAKGFGEIMRMELQQEGLTMGHLIASGPARSECAMAFLMFLLDFLLYAVIGLAYQRYKKTNYSFVKVARSQLDDKLGASMANVTKLYGSKCALSNLTLDFPRNQVSCLLGRNGAGKSTLIKLLTGQIRQSSGKVLLAGEHQVGVCWQDNILIPTLTAREHLQLYAQIKMSAEREENAGAEEIRTEVARTLQSLNFGKHESYAAWQLSGGYQRRLCVAIAFIASPSVVILDEPCNGVDAKARKDIWQLIERLRQGRAVIFATHFLDEAKYLSDSLVIMRNGSVVAQHSRESLQQLCTATYSISVHCVDATTLTHIVQQAQHLLPQSQVLRLGAGDHPHSVTIQTSYAEHLTPGAVEFLQLLQSQEVIGSISDVELASSNSLEQEFEQLNKKNGGGGGEEVRRVQVSDRNGGVARPVETTTTEEPPSSCAQFKLLMGKRLKHLSRNYRLLLYVLLLPALFELCAMWFVSYRLEDDFDTVLPLSRSLYPKTAQFLSQEQPNRFAGKLQPHLKTSCEDQGECREFNSSEQPYNWILETNHEYRERRYGGYSMNGTGATVWYNNKGYHAMVAWLNDLNSDLLRTTLNDSEYSILTLNEPWKLGFAELSTSSILRQAADSCFVFILLIAFGLVVAAGSVYLVNERENGEKLQQRLCGVSAVTYWLVAFVWDYLVMVLALIVCLAVVFVFGMPVFVDRQQLVGIVGLSLAFSFACVPAVHVAEKLFSDSSIAIVTIFCANLIIPLVTMGIILILGVVGEGPAWDNWRHALNQAFLVFPQHALGDGLLELCKNYMVALVFRRYDIDSYKHPLASDLLARHFTGLVLVGLVFLVLNVLIEWHLLRRLWQRVERLLDCHYRQELDKLGQLKLVNIQSIFKSCVAAGEAVRAENLWLAYSRGRYAVRQVHFSVQRGECFGLLGKNGAGKSTIFKLLTGQLQPNVGHIYFEQPGVSYCPQSNPLDPLLTVSECIRFYGRLRGIRQVDQFLDRMLDTYELRPYKEVKVRNLSGGNRRKLTVAVTCCGATPTVLLDEPTSDMDPVTRDLVYVTIEKLLLSRRAVVLTSHSVSEIEHLCQRVAVLRSGQVIASDTPERLKAAHGGYYAVSCFCGPAQQALLARSLGQRLTSIRDLQHYGHSLRFLVRIRAPGSPATPDQPLLSELFVVLRELCLDVGRFSLSRCRFETVFERILDSCEANGASAANGVNGKVHQEAREDLPAKSAAVSGTLETGYVHCGYEETRT
ncbi:glucosylceramide transporter ABCA12 isoform X1 [Drosophila kikkawai]|uniref:ATP-binding cassette sub-family A member 12 isoform X1 n=1 Tax=Drosophila kikkawai TaxID=30033 RepID=A0A6P4I0E3_DROKI|nr:ATP-binding cassette sub-family A member 12 isoform X1 [Drosophila kikkawai]XP_017021594.1 ATP-binding cassette sub-family A member 12 isoform X1 [Drosophila kikkawai]XP_017021595.1 ATP-binding cassette sub-family A member 12 isoform X1 [Drosophila kikkawai]